MSSIVDQWFNDNPEFVKFDIGMFDVDLTDNEDVDVRVTLPSTYYFVDFDGNSIFIKARTRSKAQELLDLYCVEWCGKKGHYKLRTARDEKVKTKGEGPTYSCTGTQTR